MLSKKSPSAAGFSAAPILEQSVKVQNVGIMIIFAPCAIISLKASGNAKSQQINMPTLPSGVSKTGCASSELLVRCNRSIEPQRFFFTYFPAISPVLVMKYATFSMRSCSLPWSCSSIIVPGTMLMLHSRARSQYFLKYVSQCAHASLNPGSFGTQLSRWYSGKTANWAPWVAAART